MVSRDPLADADADLLDEGSEGFCGTGVSAGRRYGELLLAVDHAVVDGDRRRDGAATITGVFRAFPRLFLLPFLNLRAAPTGVSSTSTMPDSRVSLP